MPVQGQMGKKQESEWLLSEKISPVSEWMELYCVQLYIQKSTCVDQVSSTIWSLYSSNFVLSTAVFIQYHYGGIIITICGILSWCGGIICPMCDGIIGKIGLHCYIMAAL